MALGAGEDVHGEGACQELCPRPVSAGRLRSVGLRCREEGKSETIAFNLSGHGHFDMTAYDRYLAGKLDDYELPQAEIDRAVAELPKV